MESKFLFSQDKQLNKLLNAFVDNIRNYSEKTAAQIKKLAKIGIALSSERNLNKLLEMIVDEARRFTNADGGTLYILRDGKLHFEIVQNDSLKIRKGGMSPEKANFQPLELNKSNVSAYAAIERRVVNIPDVYETEEFDFTGPKRFDKSTHYRSKSMLVVPMTNYEDEVIGVLQLINALDMESGEVTYFSEEFNDLTESLASQAAIAITNVKLINDIENLFESFIKVMATAIDERTPYNVNHTRRVVSLTRLLAEEVNSCQDGRFADTNFTEEELNELRIASWMHDVGKVTTPEWVMDKATKLQRIFDRIELIEERFSNIRNGFIIQALEEKLKILSSNEQDFQQRIAQVDERLKKAVNEIDDELKAVIMANQPGEFMEYVAVEKIKAIAAKKYVDTSGKERPYLTDDELKNLTIRKGSITEEERKIMQDHAAITIKMLNKIPFTKKLKQVPQYAGAHHECINGKGYPLGLKGDEVSLQARIMAIADFYEALTAQDRPYKKPLPVEVALKIVCKAAEDGCIDKDLLDLFIKNKVYEKSESVE